MAISKEEFECRYIKKSGITKELYHKNFITLPCACGEEKCEGWAVVSNQPLNIKAHRDLYSP